MTQLTVSIEDVSMLDQIRQAISLLRGVTSVILKQQNKSGMDRAIDDIKHVSYNPPIMWVIKAVSPATHNFQS